MILRLENVLAAGAIVDNIVSGKSIEFAPDDALLTIATATTATGVRMAARLTDEVILDDSAIPFLTGGQPVIPDHVVVARQAVARGDHLILRLQNTTAGALTVTTLIEVAPL